MRDNSSGEHEDMISYPGPSGSPPTMHTHSAGSPEDPHTGTFGINPTTNATPSASGENKQQHVLPFSPVHMPQTMESLDLSMSPPFMQRMAINSQSNVSSPKPFAPPSLDGKRRRTSPAVSALVSPPARGPGQGNDSSDIPQMGQTVRSTFKAARLIPVRTALPYWFGSAADAAKRSLLFPS